MRKCRYEDLIDGYLLDKLKPEEQADFEEHYFICRSCFEKMSERDEVVQILKKEGVFATEKEAEADRTAGPARPRRSPVLLTLPRWALVAVPAAVVLLAVWIFLPRQGTVSPPFVLSGDETVRGAVLTPVFPVGSLPQAPEFLEWKSAGPGMEYRVSLSGAGTDWKATAAGTRIALPDGVRSGLRTGKTYIWQVRAFTGDGTLAAVSARVKFRVVPKS
jgi:hypothetical protein